MQVVKNTHLQSQEIRFKYKTKQNKNKTVFLLKSVFPKHNPVI